jgi:hypothetical protein
MIMNKPRTKKQIRHDQKPVTSTQPVLKQTDVEQKQIDELPSVQWGDRIHSGKSIARGGKEGGFVPGAMPAP